MESGVQASHVRPIGPRWETGENTLPTWQVIRRIIFHRICVSLLSISKRTSRVCVLDIDANVWVYDYIKPCSALNDLPCNHQTLVLCLRLEERSVMFALSWSWTHHRPRDLTHETVAMESRSKIRIEAGTMLSRHVLLVSEEGSPFWLGIHRNIGAVSCRIFQSLPTRFLVQHRDIV